MSRKIRFTIYGIVALFIAVTYLFNKSESFAKLPLIGKVPSFTLVDSENKNITKEDLIDWTPEIHALALEATEGFRLAPSVYSPPSLANAEDGTRGTLSLPSSTGGANWEGAAIDP